MEIFAFLLIIIIFILLIILLENVDVDTSCKGIFVSAISALLVVICIGIYNNTIKPIDVYRGKTELKVSYINDEPVDSVVVRKINK